MKRSPYEKVGVSLYHLLRVVYIAVWYNFVPFTVTFLSYAVPNWAGKGGHDEMFTLKERLASEGLSFASKPDEVLVSFAGTGHEHFLEVAEALRIRTEKEEALGKISFGSKDRSREETSMRDPMNVSFTSKPTQHDLY